jgi:lactoylglutathione lyase
MPAKIDHLTIASSDREAAKRHYAILLPLVGFHKIKDGIWTDGEGFYLQFIKAREGTNPYERYGAGVNHWGLSMDTAEAVERLRESLIAAGIDAQPIQDLHGARALFLPDPDGLRAEFTWYPAGMPPVG